ncbi:MAG: hypothetical protein V4519_01610 [Patescibacteria group bacterium]
MSFWLILFITSGSAIVLFIALKLVQLQFGLLFFWPGIRQELEVILNQRKVKAARWLDIFSAQQMYIILHSIVVGLKGIVVAVHVWLDRKSHRLTSLIRGRHKVETNTKASHFLHDIKSFRDRFRKQ